jgi:FkbM family methyltransferase
MVLTAPFHRRHYVAFANILRLHRHPGETLARYVLGRGTYPWTCELRTPIGPVNATLHTYWDLLTLNEIFCRGDYDARTDDRVIVDIGSNIGLSALYFLSRHPHNRVTLFEPDERNQKRLLENLRPFQGRFTLHGCAVADQAGTVSFGVDQISGRYGGIGVDTGLTTEVECRHINDVLTEVLAREAQIDILKIDTEGAELRTLRAIRPDILERIKRIYIEYIPDVELFPRQFLQSSDGTVCRLERRPR